MWSLAWANVRRHRRRSLLLGASLALAGIVAILGGSVASSLSDAAARGLREGATGDLQVSDARDAVRVVTEEAPPDGHPLADLAALERAVLADPAVRAVAPRAVASGVLIAGGQSAPAILVGVDPARDRAVAHGAVLVGRALAERLHLVVGARVRLLLPGADGLFEEDEPVVGAVYDDGPQLLEEMTVYLPLEDLDLAPQALLVRLHPGRDARAAAAALAPRLAGLGQPLAVRTWEELGGPLLSIGSVGMIAAAATDEVLFAMVGLSIGAAAGLVVLARRREIGTLLALGTPRGTVVATLLMESAIVSCLAAALAAVVSVAAIAIAGHGGIPAASRAMAFAFGGPRLYPALSPAALGAGVALVALLGPLSAAAAAWRAARIDPAVALRPLE